VSGELRAPTLDDIPAAAALFRELRDRYGSHTLTESQLKDDLTRPGEGIEENYRIEVEDGRVTGYIGLWSPEAQRDRAFALVRALPRERAAYARLLDWAEGRVRELGGGGPMRLQAAADEGDGALVEEFESRGFELARHFFEMEIDLTDEPPAPEWPEGLGVRTFRPEDARAVYDADLEAFEDHWDPLDVTFEEWCSYFLDASDFDPELWFVVEDGEELAGFSLCSRRAGETEGHLHVLGVRRPWRKRGLGTALLLQSFRELRRRGCKTTRLNVDADNLTGALRLYERAGMHVALRSDRYWKHIA
jgi:mycothiol synthase